MDDYYSLLGVDESAPTSDIRAAYREKKAALDAKGDKSEVARVNKAWNVLSDPYQRGRYDEQRARGETSVEVVDAPDGGSTASSGNGAPPRRRRLFEPAPPREPRPVPQPTIDLPEGMQFAAQKARLMAFAFDIIVMFVILLGLQAVLLDRVTESWYPDEHAALSAIEDDPEGSEKSQIEEAQDAADESEEAADEAEDNDADNAAELREQADADEQAYEDVLDEQARLGRKMYPAFLFVLGIAMLINFLYLFIPSGISGQTIGKKIRKIRVVRVDGSPLGWAGAFVRYGLLVLAGTVLFLFAGMFGVLGLLLVGGLFFLVLGWMRNPNKQALQDRVAKTIVVDA